MTDETKEANVENQERDVQNDNQPEAPKEPTKEELQEARNNDVDTAKLEGAQKRISELNKENEKRRNELKTWKSLEEETGYDADKIKSLIQQQKDLERKQKEEEGRYQELIDEMRNETESVKARVQEEKDQELSAMRNSLNEHLINGTVSDALAKEKVSSKLLKKHITEQLQVIQDENGKYKTVVVDENGEPRTKRGGASYTVDDLVSDMKEDEEFSRLFPAPNVSGPGTTSADKSNSKVVTGKPRSQMTSKEKSDFQREHGFDKYFALPL